MEASDDRENGWARALALLPHGPGFRFVDELTALEGGKNGRARYAVRGDELFLAGHFPDHPMVPGVILIEALAQLAGVVAQSDPLLAPWTDLRLAAVRSAKIAGAVVPGEILEMEVRVTGRLGRLIQAEGTIRVGGRDVLTAGVVLSGEPGDGPS